MLSIINAFVGLPARERAHTRARRARQDLLTPAKTCVQSSNLLFCNRGSSAPKRKCQTEKGKIHKKTRRQESSRRRTAASRPPRSPPPPADISHPPHGTHQSRTRPQPCSRERSRVRVTSDSADARRPTDRPVNQPQSATVTRPPSRGSPLRHLPLLVQTPPHNPDPSPPPSRRAQHSSTPCLLARRHPATVT